MPTTRLHSSEQQLLLESCSSLCRRINRGTIGIIGKSEQEQTGTRRGAPEQVALLYDI